MPPFMDFHPDQKLAAEALAQIAGTRHMRADQFGGAVRLPETGRETATRTRASIVRGHRFEPSCAHQVRSKETVC